MIFLTGGGDMNKPYVEYVCDFIANQETGKPIYAHEISRCVAETYHIPLKKAAGAVSVANNPRIEVLSERHLLPCNNHSIR